MSKNKTFTGPLAEHIQRFLNEKRSLGYKYEEQERVLYVLDQMSNSLTVQMDSPKTFAWLLLSGILTGDRKRRNNALH